MALGVNGVSGLPDDYVEVHYNKRGEEVFPNTDEGTTTVPMVTVKQPNLDKGFTVEHTTDQNTTVTDQNAATPQTTNYKIKVGERDEVEIALTEAEVATLQGDDLEARHTLLQSKGIEDGYVAAHEDVQDNRTTGITELNYDEGTSPRLKVARHVWDETYTNQRRDELIANYKLQAQHGDANFAGKSDDELTAMANQAIKNEQRGEEFEGRRIFLDKDQYKAAERARKAERKTLIEQYRQKHPEASKSEAKRWADAQLVDNKYLHKGLFGSSARKFYQRNEDLFFENGQFSNLKAKQFAFDTAQGESHEGEDANYYTSLNEAEVKRNEMNSQALLGDKSRHTTKHQQRMVSKVAGIKTQKSYDTAITLGIIGVAAGTGAAAGAAIAPIGIGASAGSAASATAGAAGAAVAGSEAAAAAGASITLGPALLATAGGVGGGLLASPAALFRFTPNKESDHIYGTRTYTPVAAKMDGINLTRVEQPCVDPDPIEEDVCRFYTLNGETWYDVAGGYADPADPTKTVAQSGNRALQKALMRALKLKNGVTDRRLNTMDVTTVKTKKVNGKWVVDNQNGRDRKVGTMMLYQDFSDILTAENLSKFPELRLLVSNSTNPFNDQYGNSIIFVHNCGDKAVATGGNGTGRTPWTRYNGSATNPFEYQEHCATGQTTRRIKQ